MNAPPEEEWTLAEKFQRVKAAGFEAVECWLDESNEARHKAALDATGLRLVLGHHPFSVEDTRRVVTQAKRLEADYPLRPALPSRTCRLIRGCSH